MPIATIRGAAPHPAAGKKLKYLQLWDTYAPLLTETQRDMCEMYYMLDLSLSEIAEQKGVSKQSVSDTLKTSRQLMDSYEERLHFCDIMQTYSLTVSDMMTRVTNAVGEFAQSHPEFAGEMQAIADMVCVGEAIDFDEEE